MKNENHVNTILKKLGVYYEVIESFALTLKPFKFGYLKPKQYDIPFKLKNWVYFCYRASDHSTHEVIEILEQCVLEKWGFKSAKLDLSRKTHIALRN